ncbi:hypothetical protein EBT31_20930, partial [bacterium]|nr:hypothetical protein [bacterium]
MFDIAPISLYRGKAGYLIYRDIIDQVNVAIRSPGVARHFSAATSTPTTGSRFVGFRAVLGSGGNGASGDKNTVLLFRDEVRIQLTICQLAYGMSFHVICIVCSQVSREEQYVIISRKLLQDELTSSMAKALIVGSVLAMKLIPP